MRVLADPATGELVEVPHEGTFASAEPYDLRQARTIANSLHVEKQRTLTLLEKAIDEKAEAEGAYRRVLADHMRAAKDEHGATVAEKIAKGHPEVVEASERRDRAKDRVDALKERLKLGSEDRASFHRLLEMSTRMEPGGEG